MAYCGTLTLHDADGRALHTIQYGRMPKSDPVALSKSLAADAAALLAKRPEVKLCVLTDGAVQLHTLLDNALTAPLPDITIHRLVDYWHVVEKIGEAAVLIHGDGEGRHVLARWKVSLLNSANAISHIINGLENSRCSTKRVGEARPVDDALRYLRNHRERMGYSAARALGLPIGSGNVEATCKALVGQRFRRPGARWKEESGQEILDLRALALSDRFHEAIDLTLALLRREVRAACSGWEPHPLKQGEAGGRFGRPKTRKAGPAASSSTALRRRRPYPRRVHTGRTGTKPLPASLQFSLRSPEDARSAQFVWPTRTRNPVALFAAPLTYPPRSAARRLAVELREDDERVGGRAPGTRPRFGKTAEGLSHRVTRADEDVEAHRRKPRRVRAEVRRGVARLVYRPRATLAERRAGHRVALAHLRQREAPAQLIALGSTGGELEVQRRTQSSERLRAAEQRLCVPVVDAAHRE
jgi:hypothetical protein